MLGAGCQKSIFDQHQPIAGTVSHCTVVFNVRGQRDIHFRLVPGDEVETFTVPVDPSLSVSGGGLMYRIKTSKLHQPRGRASQQEPAMLVALKQYC